jgi:hypothetical protein
MANITSADTIALQLERVRAMSEKDSSRERVRVFEEQRRIMMEMVRTQNRVWPERFDESRWDMMRSLDGAAWGSNDMFMAPQSEPDRKAIPRGAVALAEEGEGENELAKEAEALLGYGVLRRKLKIAGRLGEVLALLDIEPLNSVAVEKYKADMVLWRMKQLQGSSLGMATNRRYDLDDFGRRYVMDVAWRRVALGKCKEEVPLFALRKAVQVKKACPEAILEVDELMEEKKLIDPFLLARLDDETYYLEVWKEPKFEETL